jgi:hypothetical protein
MRAMFLAAAALWCASASAATWVRVGVTVKHMAIYVDESSVEVDGDRRTAWAKLEYPHHAAKSEDGTKYESVILERMDFLCSSRQWRGLNVNVSYEDGSTASNDAPGEWVAVPPDTFADHVMNYLCQPATPAK